MNMIHAYVEVEAIFFGGKESTIKAVSEPTYNQMVQGIGKTFSMFDKKQHVRLEYKVLIVRQATEEDYKTTGIKQFINQPINN